MTLALSQEEAERKAIDRTRSNLVNFAGRAAEILQELAEFADNDRIRLSAVNSILDRAGVIAPDQQAKTPSQEEHDIVKDEAEKTLERIKKNAELAAKVQVAPSLEALMLHEAQGDDVTHQDTA